MRRLAGLDVRAVRIIGRGHGFQHAEVMLADGSRAFAKLTPDAAAEGAPAATH